MTNKNTVFNYSNFYNFLQNEVEKFTRTSRGKKKELAESLNIHPTSLSQVFSGTRLLNEEQVFLLGEFLGLSEIESQYLQLLHQIESSGNKKFKERLNQRKEVIKSRSLNLSERIDKDKILSEEEKAIFYSSWHYTCSWVYISLEGGKTKDEISERLKINKKQVSEILEFLLKSNLCDLKNGKYHHRVNRTHLEKSSPYLKQHHSNWRIKAIQKLDSREDEDLTFTAPLSLSKSDFEKLREEMVQLIQKVSKTVTETDPEEIYCFNLDFFKI